MQEDYSGKKVLVRVDFNVPLDNENRVLDSTRIEKALPTIKHILEHGGAVILMSHLGRPLKKLNEDGTIDTAKFSLQNILETLIELLGVNVIFCGETVGQNASQMAANLQNGQILLLENTRFNEGETNGDEGFAKSLASLGDHYVNDAFGAAHRAHASTAIVAQYFDDDSREFGLLMQKEIEQADKVLNQPAKPFVAILGGAKVSDKIQLIESLLPLADHIIIGGAKAYTFWKAMNGKIGNSLCEEDYIDLAKELLKKAESQDTQIHLPEDSVAANSFSNEAEFKVVPSNAIPDDWMGLDIGPNAIQHYKRLLLNVGTIIWNGPMGVFEMSNFAKGTFELANAVAIGTENGAFSLVGGGDSVSALNLSGLADKVSFVSTGGGAMLEYLEGKELPGIAAIRKSSIQALDQ